MDNWTMEAVEGRMEQISMPLGLGSVIRGCKRDNVEQHKPVFDGIYCPNKVDSTGEAVVCYSCIPSLN